MTLEQDKIFDKSFERKIKKKLPSFNMSKITCASMKQNHEEFLNKTYGSRITYKNIKI